MKNSHENTVPILPVEIVLSPSWWYRHADIVFDEDFYFHPVRRVDVERQMEQVLYDRWGAFGLGADHGQDRPEVGSVHLAAGFLLPAMCGCPVEYPADAPPQVRSLEQDTLAFDLEAPFRSEVFRKFQRLQEALKDKYGRLCGDVNWSGVLNLAMDLRGQTLFMDFFDQPDAVRTLLGQLAQVCERFVAGIERETGSSSISVNRSVRHRPGAVFLHSACSLTMVSCEQYEQFLMPFDVAWARRATPFGIHYCGADPHRYAASFAKLPRLDFLDLGWGGDVAELRRHLPGTFFNVRLSPVEFVGYSAETIRTTVRRLVQESAAPELTGLCCINLDHRVSDAQITALLEAVQELRDELSETVR